MIRLQYHDAFDYDESDRNCDMRSIRLWYDYNEQVGQLIADGPRNVHVIITLYRH